MLKGKSLFHTNFHQKFSLQIASRTFIMPYSYLINYILNVLLYNRLQLNMDVLLLVLTSVGNEPNYWCFKASLKNV